MARAERTKEQLAADAPDLNLLRAQAALTRAQIVLRLPAIRNPFLPFSNRRAL